VVIALDGENAWEYYPGSGRAFLREFYRRIENDPEIRALTVSEALAEAGEIPTVEHIFPGSWINANFDIWIGDQEDVRAWELLRDAREFYSQAVERGRRGGAGPGDAPTAEQLAKAYESLLAAEGSDWCWWYGPQHATANDPEFDALYRKHLTEVYVGLGAQPPELLASPIKRRPERALVVPPSAYLDVRVDGRESSYFEWLGAGLYAVVRQGATMHGRAYYLHALHYGFDEQNLYLRVDAFPEALRELHECEFRVRVSAQSGEDELRFTVRVENARLAGFQLESNSSDTTLSGGEADLEVALDKILEVRIGRPLLRVPASGALFLGVALWQGGLPVDLLPVEGLLKIRLGAEAFGWELTEKS